MRDDSNKIIRVQKIIDEVEPPVFFNIIRSVSVLKTRCSTKIVE